MLENAAAPAIRALTLLSVALAFQNCTSIPVLYYSVTLSLTGTDNCLVIQSGPSPYHGSSDETVVRQDHCDTCNCNNM
jgi:hypothetical protein